MLLAYLGPVVVRMGGATPENAAADWLGWVWAGCAVLAALWSAGQRRPGRRSPWRLVLVFGTLLALFAVALAAVRAVAAGPSDFELRLLEASALAYLGFGLLWAATFGLDHGRPFVTAGTVLAVLLLLETLRASLAAGAVARPLGSFGLEAQACLLLVSLCFSLPSFREQRVTTILLILGIVATFSRSSLLCAAVLVGLLGPGRPRRRAVAVLAMAGLLFAAGWLGRTPEAGLLRLEWFWTWAAGVDALASHPMALLAGFAPDQPVPVTFQPPEVLLGLWESMSPGRAALPTLPVTFGPFWLRLVLSWGLGPLLLFFVGFPVLLGFVPTKPLGGLFVVILVCGAVTSLAYDPALGAVLGMALYAGSGEQVELLHSGKAGPEARGEGHA